jgi:hypothetical protein
VKLEGKRRRHLAQGEVRQKSHVSDRAAAATDAAICQMGTKTNATLAVELIRPRGNRRSKYNAAPKRLAISSARAPIADGGRLARTKNTTPKGRTTQAAKGVVRMERRPAIRTSEANATTAPPIVTARASTTGTEKVGVIPGVPN